MKTLLLFRRADVPLLRHGFMTPQNTAPRCPPKCALHRYRIVLSGQLNIAIDADGAVDNIYRHAA